MSVFCIPYKVMSTAVFMGMFFSAYAITMMTLTLIALIDPKVMSKVDLYPTRWLMLHGTYNHVFGNPRKKNGFDVLIGFIIYAAMLTFGLVVLMNCGSA